ncbi:MAG TPA: hypothetical protein VK604_04445 [Bryobacteraceae bacterium]|nr:hypothetical protein [Bryobacteraceae bacterium]
MSFEGLLNIKKAISTLNPSHVREMTEYPLQIALHAPDTGAFERLEDFFLRELTLERRRASALALTRVGVPGYAQTPGQSVQVSSARFDLSVYDAGMLAPSSGLIFHPERAERFPGEVLARQPDLGVALARTFLPFRRPYVDSVISKTCKENTLFSLATALPDIVPSLIELPWAIAEFASDTAFLTMNQVRMAFLIAGASDREVGYTHQKTEIATVIGSAFGWRALARQAVGKIPFGGGLIAKAAVAYAGTKVLGLSLDHYYGIGYTYSRQERERLYDEALQQGKAVASKILHFLRPDIAAKLARREHRGGPSGQTVPGN